MALEVLSTKLKEHEYNLLFCIYNKEIVGQIVL